MSEILPHFTLPFANWYDSEGRIYKDALISNFNAIEDKLNMLSELNADEIVVPDWSTVHIDDIDINTSADNKVVNLKSLINTLQLVNFPIKVEFTGKTCDEIQYYDSSYQLQTISDIELSDLDEDTKQFVFINQDSKELYCTGNYTNTNNHIFIGVYESGVVNHNYSADFCDINALSILAKMPFETYSRTLTHNSRETDILKQNGRLRVAYQANTSSPDWSLKYYDFGRKGVKERS